MVAEMWLLFVEHEGVRAHFDAGEPPEKRHAQQRFMKFAGFRDRTFDVAHGYIADCNA